MKKQQILLLLWICTVQLISAQTWLRQFTNSNELSGYIMEQSHDGHMLICGSIIHNAAPDEIFICKTDTNQQILWQKRYSSADELTGLTIHELDDHGLVMMARIDLISMLVIRMDSIGQVLWSREINNPSAPYFSNHYYGKIIESAAGHLLITMYSPYYYAGYSYHSLVVLLNSDGSLKWKKAYGSNYGSIFFHSGLALSEGNFLLYGWSWPSTPWNAHIVKIDSLGNILLNKQFARSGASQRETLQEVKQGPNGTFYMVGSARYSGWDYGWGFLSQLDQNLNPIWARRFGTSSTSTGLTDFQVLADRIIAVGGTNQIGNGLGDALIIETDLNGALNWNQSYGTNGSEGFQKIFLQDSNRFLISGRFQDQTTGFYNPTLTIAQQGQLFCNSSTGTISTDTLIWNSSTLPGFSQTNAPASVSITPYSLTVNNSNLSIDDPCAPLSVEHIQLSAAINGSQVHLGVISSLAEGHFILERSKDQQDWKSVEQGDWESGTVEKSFIDRQPLPGIQLYRLKQVDLYGQIHYSNLVEIDYQVQHNIQILTSRDGHPILSVHSARPMNLHWRCMDLSGRIVGERNGLQIQEGNYEQELVLRQGANGVYFFQIFEGTEMLATIKWMR